MPELNKTSRILISIEYSYEAACQYIPHIDAIPDRLAFER
jgi:hypothetical protein